MFNNLPSPLPTVMPSGQTIPEMSKIAGPLFLGIAFNWSLFRVLTVQVYVYLLAFRGDRIMLRAIVYCVYCVEALQSILIARDAYDTFVIGGMCQRNPYQLYQVHTLWLSVPVLTGLVTFTCQGLFAYLAYRIWVLSMNRSLLKFAFVAICVSCLVELASSIVLAVALKQVGSFDLAEDAPSFTVMTGLWYCSSSFGDILIAICMVYLVSQTNTNMSRHTQTFLHKVVRLTIGTASVTAVIAIITLLLTVNIDVPSHPIQAPSVKSPIFFDWTRCEVSETSSHSCCPSVRESALDAQCAALCGGVGRASRKWHAALVCGRWTTGERFRLVCTLQSRLTENRQLLGSAFNTTLFGVLSVQVLLYSIGGPKDKLLLKAIVYVVFFLEGLQSILIIRDIFHVFVYGGMVERDPQRLMDVNNLWLSVPVLTGLVTFICQGLFAYRIWVLSMGRLVFKIAFFAICISCLVELASSLVLAVALKNIGSLDIANVSDSFSVMTGIWYCSSTFGDVLIAGCMVYLSISQRTNVFLHRVVRLTIGTASATAVIAVVTLLLTVIGPIYPSYYQASLAVLGKMYSNSMMVMLNNRLRVSARSPDDLGMWSRQKEKDMHSGTIVLTEISFSQGTTTMPSAFMQSSTSSP
ncbi:hypothetical protein D9619_012568 [Psilocybe cf. subviscida]|uniref:DUF6534 domain-containing protein n=1 Tax=Psilocybe cf. subviscida TaxID=2480587 RepID=A0A8H5B718_9AGAR|nr:hypothetical protein D9619_012568 [Psilocybe cf. subviscida]